MQNRFSHKSLLPDLRNSLPPQLPASLTPFRFGRCCFGAQAGVRRRCLEGSIGVPLAQRQRMPPYVQLSNFQTSKLSNFHTFKLSNFHTFKLSNFQTFKLSNFQTCKLSNFHTFKLQTFKLSNFGKVPWRESAGENESLKV